MLKQPEEPGESDKRSKDRVSYPGADGPPPSRCQQCRQCQAQCPAGLEIPGLMRAYMYAFGHKRPEKALETLHGWNSAGLACRDCAACTVRCALGFDIRTRALELAGVLENG